ncbi:MAG: lipopolysaccharide heptosyltransferase I [Hylemonella sp.]|nr:lipopolysaccharide heptosyltransferase I [Hylemonella sp.]
MKILIVKLSSLGDVVHAMPVVQDIRRAMPHAEVDWVVERGFAPLVRRCAGVGRVIECELRRWRKAPLSSDTRRAFASFKADLHSEAYDAVLDLQGLSKSALVAWLTRLTPQGRRYAMANQTEGSGYEAPTRWVADVAVTLPTHIHALTRSRELSARVLAYQLPDSISFGLQAKVVPLPDAIKGVASEATTAPRVVALVHGTSRADKLWPVANWIELALALHAQGLAVALPHGSDEEARRATEIAAALPNAVVWPRLALDELVDRLGACVGVIGVDSGLSHIAVALDRPHVQLYNFDTAWRTGPVNRPRQRSVFAQPAPSVDAVWQAWRVVSSNGGQT